MGTEASPKCNHKSLVETEKCLLNKPAHKLYHSRKTTERVIAKQLQNQARDSTELS